MVDYNPEVFVGRLVVSNNQTNDILNWINKVIQYETNPFGGDRASLGKILWSSSDQMNDRPDALLNLYPSYFTHLVIRELPDGGDANPTSPTGNDIISELNNRYGFYNIYNHGSKGHYAVRTLGLNLNQGPKYGIFSYDSYDNQYPGYYVLENGNGFDNITTSSTIIYSIACEVGAFDNDLDPEECMAKTYLRLAERGGPAFVGNTRSGFFPGSDYLHQAFLDALFLQSLTNIGVAEGISKTMYINHYLNLSHNLFGDPEMPIGIPTHPKVGGSTNEHSNNFTLNQNTPNPFNYSTDISFYLPVQSNVTMNIYDLYGRKISTLANGSMNEGYHNLTWKPLSLPSGLYICELNTEIGRRVVKMFLMK